MIDQGKAIEFIRRNGDPLALAQLDWALSGTRPSYAITFKLFENQRYDGGFAPLWAPDSSSIDATCYRLAQAEHLGLDYNDTQVSDALRYLNAQQRPSGQFSEDPRLEDVAPPWAKPGDPAAALYLTANAGFWLAQSPYLQMSAGDAASFIHKSLNHETGQLPTFLNGYWLSAGLWWILAEQETAVLVLNHLQSHLSEMGPADLAWLLNTLRIARVPESQSPIPAAVEKLRGLQENDGRFPSEESQDVHVTLETLRAIQYYR